jgi:signal peptide peptidase SppA
LADRFGITHLFRADGVMVAASMVVAEGDAVPARNRPYQMVDGVAVVPIRGTLVHRLGTLQPFSGMTGYDGIRANLSLALSDPEIRAIVLDIDSPGGEVSGCFDLVDAIYAARGQKPIWAILAESAYSAGYALASAADRIIVPRSGGVGSIGVVCVHVDISKALAASGIVPTIIQYGAKKANACEIKPLSQDAQSDLQRDIDAMGELFVRTVARNRKLSVGRVRNTEAATFLGARGVDIGLADAVMAPDQAFRALFKTLS